MMDNGIGMDMVSLSRPPLHTAPLFISKRRVPVDMAPATSQEAATVAAAAAARMKDHEQLFPRQHGVDSPLAGAGAGGGGSRRMSITSDEALPREQPKYEVSVKDVWLKPASTEGRKMSPLGGGEGGGMYS